MCNETGEKRNKQRLNKDHIWCFVIYAAIPMSLHILVIFWLHARVFWRPDMVWLTKWPVTRGKPSSEAVCNSRSASCACPGWSLSAYFTAGIEPRWEGPMCHWDEATQTEVAADEKHSCGQDFPITPPPLHSSLLRDRNRCKLGECFFPAASTIHISW